MTLDYFKPEKSTPYIMCDILNTLFKTAVSNAVVKKVTMAMANFALWVSKGCSVTFFRHSYVTHEKFSKNICLTK